MNAIHPTHTCFDDALDYLGEIAAKHPAALIFENIRLVHAICLMPDGTPYSHGWVESDAFAYFFGICDGERIRIQVDAKEYRRELKVIESTEYTYEQAYQENYRHRNFGPWVEKYRKLCR